MDRQTTLRVVYLTVLCLALISLKASAAASVMTISEGSNQVRVVLLADDVIRIRVGPRGVFLNDRNPEYAVIKPDSEWPGAHNRS